MSNCRERRHPCLQHCRFGNVTLLANCPDPAESTLRLRLMQAGMPALPAGIHFVEAVASIFSFKESSRFWASAVSAETGNF